MYLAYIRGCYAAATSLGMGGVGGDINVHVPCLHRWMLRCCYVTGHGWGGGDINVHVPCLHTWMLRCCYVTGHGWGGGDINVHVPCLHTWMLRCCYVTGHGWGGGDINVHVPCLHTWMLRCCYVTGHGWGGGDINVHVPCLHTWMLRCCEFLEHLEDLLPQDWCCQMRKKKANPCIDKVVTSFQKDIKIIVSLRRKRHFANFPMEFSHKKCIHLKLEKTPYKRTENQCWMILNLHFEPRPSMRRVPSFLGVFVRAVGVKVWTSKVGLHACLCTLRSQRGWQRTDYWLNECWFFKGCTNVWLTNALLNLCWRLQAVHAAALDLFLDLLLNDAQF